MAPDAEIQLVEGWIDTAYLRIRPSLNWFPQLVEGWIDTASPTDGRCDAAIYHRCA